MARSSLTGNTEMALLSVLRYQISCGGYGVLHRLVDMLPSWAAGPRIGRVALGQARCVKGLEPHTSSVQRVLVEMGVKRLVALEEAPRR